MMSQETGKKLHFARISERSAIFRHIVAPKPKRGFGPGQTKDTCFLVVATHRVVLQSVRLYFTLAFIFGRTDLRTDPDRAFEIQLVAGFALWVNLSKNSYLPEFPSTQSKVTPAF
jgi:hypothetical protein